MKWESKSIILELKYCHSVSSEEQAATDSTPTIKSYIIRINSVLRSTKLQRP